MPRSLPMRWLLPNCIARSTAPGNCSRNFPGIRCVGGHGRCHELCCIVGFQVSRVECNNGVTGSVGFVKTIATERFDQCKEFFGYLFFDPIFDASLHEISSITL